MARKTDNENSSLEKRVEVLENAVKALVNAIQDAEKQLKVEIMPEGTYFGVKFED